MDNMNMSGSRRLAQNTPVVGKPIIASGPTNPDVPMAYANPIMYKGPSAISTSFSPSRSLMSTPKIGSGFTSNGRTNAGIYGSNGSYVNSLYNTY